MGFPARVLPSDVQARSNAIVVSTWANRATAIATIAALIPSTGLVYISDIGLNGSLWYCNGVTLKLMEAAIRMPGVTVGVILPSLVAANLATYSQTGTTITVDNTVGHGIPATVHDGSRVYLKVSTGSLVEGLYTNFQRTGANTFTCESTISQSISGFLASNTAQTTIISMTLPGGLLGTTGWIETPIQIQFSSSTNAKTPRIIFGGSTYWTIPLTTTGNLSQSVFTGIRNKNSVTSQQALSTSFTATGLGQINNNLVTMNKDTASDVVIDIAFTVAAANEYLALEHCSLLVYPS